MRALADTPPCWSLQSLAAEAVRGTEATDNTALLAAVRVGDREAIGRLLESLLPRVRGWLYRLLGQCAELDDAVQDSLVELVRALPRFRGESGVQTYAHRVVVRVGYRYLRQRVTRREREEPLDDEPPAAVAWDPESVALQRELLRRLHEGLDQLSPKRRVAYVLCELEGYTPAEAAELLRLPGVTVRARLKHARRAVAAWIQQDPVLARAGRSVP